MENFNEQLDANLRMLNSNPEDFTTNYNVGNLYYSYGHENLVQADKIEVKDSDDGKSLLSSGNAMLENSMPYLEKAFELKPENEEVVSKLMSVYSQLSLDHKIKGINERIKDTQ
ncbi:MAG: hypothetical protein K9H16_08470 [Bacteroidales bacterium]|nr:hypothetical protein [Bacteroidales bacterium]